MGEKPLTSDGLFHRPVLVVLLAPYVQYLCAGCLGIFTRITNEGREIVGYTNSGDGTSANTVRTRAASTEMCPDPAMKREIVDTGSAEISLTSLQ